VAFGPDLRSESRPRGVKLCRHAPTSVALLAVNLAVAAPGAYSRPMTRLRAVYRALKRLATDERLPRPVRWLLVFGLLPVPGPVDEVALGAEDKP